MMPYVVCIFSRLLSDPMAFIGNWPLDDLGDVFGRVRQPPCHLRWRKYGHCALVSLVARHLQTRRRLEPRVGVLHQQPYVDDGRLWSPSVSRRRRSVSCDSVRGVPASFPQPLPQTELIATRRCRIRVYQTLMEIQPWRCKRGLHISEAGEEALPPKRERSPRGPGAVADVTEYLRPHIMVPILDVPSTVCFS